MTSPRVEALISRLEKGKQKSNEILGKLLPEQWEQTVFAGPPVWAWRDLLAHFVSAEERLLEVAQDVANGGKGTPEGFNFDDFNAQELPRYQDYPFPRLLAMLDIERQETLDWVATLDDTHLDRTGRHPALGIVSVEAMVTAIYGHQLLHMREVQSKK
jgi:hypothetical protein